MDGFTDGTPEWEKFCKIIIIIIITTN